MYNLTDTFRSAMNSFTIQPVLRGTVDGRAFTHDDILVNTFRCSNQCIASNNTQLGGVFIGELQLTFLDTIADQRGNWVGRKINCEYGLVTEAGPEYIPCPSYQYTIYSADWTENGLKIVAYDNMVLLEKNYDKEQTSGTAWAWLQFVSRKTGIRLGNTEAEVNAMPNGSKILGIASADNVETFRDLVSYLSAALAGYATIDRTGALIIKQFKGTVVASIDPNNRFTGCVFSDYTTRYTGLSAMNTSDGTVSYYHLNPDDGLTMKMGNNPFLQLGIQQEEIRLTILNELTSYNYVPYKATLLGCCAYDLGDLIRFTGGIAKNTVGCIMAYDFTLNSYSVAGYGDNPALENVQTKTDKNITGITRSKATDNLSVTSLTNINRVGITPSWTEIGSLSFSVNKKQIVLFHGVSKMDIDTPGNVKYMYTLNEQPIDFIHDVRVFEGVDTTTLFIYLNVEPDVYNNLRVYVSSENATGSVEPLNMRGSVIGAGISINEFDGTLSFFDTFGFALNGQLNVRFIDNVPIIGLMKPEEGDVSDVYGLDIDNGLDIGLEDAIKITLTAPPFVRTTTDGSVRRTTDNDYREI